MDHDLKFYSLILVLLLICIASILKLNLLLIIASLIIACLLVVLYRLHYIVDAVIFKRSNLIQMVDGCELSGERTTAIRRIGKNFCSTSVALLQNSSNSAIDRQKIENIIANSNSPFRFVMQVEKIDLNKLLDGLKTKRSIKEIEMSKLKNTQAKNNSLKENLLKRQIEQIDHDIESISSGSAPLKVSQYIMTSAISENKFIAQERSKSQIRELTSEFSALLGAKSQILIGNELLHILKFDSMINHEY